jgi:hypothetical protein
MGKAPVYLVQPFMVLLPEALSEGTRCHRASAIGSGSEQWRLRYFCLCVLHSHTPVGVLGRQHRTVNI